MANPEHVEILKQGVDAWNYWRLMHPEFNPNLEDADLTTIDIRGAILEGANLEGAVLDGVNLDDTSLDGAYLYRASLTEASLVNASLEAASFEGAIMENANLDKASLSGTFFNAAIMDHASIEEAFIEEASFVGASMKGVSLRRSNLFRANFARTELSNAFLDLSTLFEASFDYTILKDTSFEDALLDNTKFNYVDLSNALGLDHCHHLGPSSIDKYTQSQSGKLPVSFMRGCGFSDWEIEVSALYQSNLTQTEIRSILSKVYDLRINRSPAFGPLFISYNHKDSDFVNTLESYLNSKGIPFWRDIRHGTAGRLERQVDRAMRLNPTVLLILSKNSVESDWVEHEAESARELEKELHRDILCPVALDNSWKDCKWDTRLRRQIEKYNILDFSQWQDPEMLNRQFSRLLDGLDIYYK